MSPHDIDKELMDAALSSPDAAVRNVALRLKAIEAEKAPLADFLQMYVKLAGDCLTTAAEPQLSGGGNPDTILCALLQQIGKPMTLNELHTEFSRRFPTHSPDRKEALRQRLLRLRKSGRVTLDNGSYTLTDTPGG